MKRNSAAYINEEGCLIKVTFLRRLKSEESALVRLSSGEISAVGLNKVLTAEEGDLILEKISKEALEDGVECRVVSSDASSYLKEMNSIEEDDEYPPLYWEDKGSYSVIDGGNPWDVPDDFVIIRVKNRVLEVMATELDF